MGALAAAAMVGTGASAPTAPAPAAMSLPGISSQYMEDDGITLSVPPPGAAVKVPSQQVVASMPRLPGAGPIRQVVLATVHDRSAPPDRQDHVFWVVDVTPADGVDIPDRQGIWHSTPPNAFFLVFVDPLTGTWVYATQH